MKKMMAVLLTLSLLLGMMTPAMADAASRTLGTLGTPVSTLPTSPTTFGEKIAAVLFAEEGGEEVFDYEDRIIFMDLWTLFKTVDDIDGLTQAYTNAFAHLLGGQQTRLEQMGATVLAVKTFAKFMKANPGIDTMSNARKYLGLGSSGPDPVAFAKAFNDRESLFMDALVDSGANMDKVLYGLERFSLVAKYLSICDTWYPETFLLDHNYSENVTTYEMRLDEGRAKKVIEAANEILKDGIDTSATAIAAIAELAVYFNQADNDDRNAMITYLDYYFFLVHQRVYPPPSNPPASSSSGTQVGTQAGTTSIQTPVPTIIDVNDDGIAGAAGTYRAGTRVEGDILYAHFMSAMWNQVKADHKTQTVILVADTTTTVRGTEFTIDYPVLKDFIAKGFRRIILQTPTGNYTFRPGTFESIMANKVLNGEASAVADTAKLTFSLIKMKSGEQLALPKIQQDALVSGQPVYANKLMVQKTVSAASTTYTAIAFDKLDSQLTLGLPYALKDGQDETGIIVNYLPSDGTVLNSGGDFDPDLDRISVRLNHFSNYGIGYNPQTFTDLSQTTWAEKFVKSLTAKNIIAATGKTFRPNAPVTRAEFVKMLVMVKALELAGTNDFTDLSDADWVKAYVAAAVKDGLVAKALLFNPNKKISREEMAAMIVRSMGDEAPAASFANLTFIDKNKTSQYAREPIAQAVEAEIITGKTGNRLDPLGDATRAEAATMLYKLMQFLTTGPAE